MEEYNKWILQINIEKRHHIWVGGKQQNLILEAEKSLNTAIPKIYRNRGQKQQRKKSNNPIKWYPLESISITNKHNIYNTIVKNIITYGSDVWPLKESYKKKLEATELDF